MTVKITNVRSDDSVLFRNIDGTLRSGMVVDLSQEPDTNGIYQILLEAQIRETGFDDWRSSQTLGPGSSQVRFLDVEVGTEYDFRFRHVYSNGTIDTWADSWLIYDDDGILVDTVTSHMIIGNQRLPPDATALTITTTENDSLKFNVTAAWLPVDLVGYELRYFLGVTADWSAMTSIGVVPDGYETSDFAGGDYTFAVKLITYAVDPHEDLLATPPTPKLYNESNAAFFQAYSVIAAVSYQVTTVTATAYTCAGTNEMVVADTTSNGIAITLPAPDAGRVVTVKKVALANTVTVLTPGAELIDGAANHTLTPNYSYVSVICDGSNWWDIS